MMRIFVSAAKLTPWNGAVVFGDGQDQGLYYENWPDRWLPVNYYTWGLSEALRACQRGNWVEWDQDLMMDEGL
jgi:hypothetical protein